MFYYEKNIGGIAIVVIALAVAFNVSLNTGKTNNASLLALANVEALASESTTVKKYQTMGHCTPGKIDFMCTTTVYANSCTKPCP